MDARTSGSTFEKAREIAILKAIRLRGESLVTHRPGTSKTQMLVNNARMASAGKRWSEDEEKEIRIVMPKGRPAPLATLGQNGEADHIERVIRARTRLILAIVGLRSRRRDPLHAAIASSKIQIAFRRKNDVHESVEKVLRMTESQLGRVLKKAADLNLSPEKAFHLIAQYVDEAVEKDLEVQVGNKRVQVGALLSDLDALEFPIAEALFNMLPANHAVKKAYGQPNRISYLADIIRVGRVWNGGLLLTSVVAGVALFFLSIAPGASSRSQSIVLKRAA